jgi:hypothetical protein
MNTNKVEDIESQESAGQLYPFIERMIDQVTIHDHQKIQNYVDNLRLKNNSSNRLQIAHKIIKHQSNISGLSGAFTGMGGLITLPLTIPLDLVKHLHIQAYTICCLSYLYEYSLDRLDLKTDLLLILSHGSFSKIADFLAREAELQVRQESVAKRAIAQLMSQTVYKQGTAKAFTKVGQSFGAKYIAKVAVDMGSKTLRDYALRNLPKIFRSVIWKIAGKKIAQQTIQKSLTKVVPVIGAVIGGGMDWWSTNSAGKAAIDYYENDGPNFVEEIYRLMNLDEIDDAI